MAARRDAWNTKQAQEAIEKNISVLEQLTERVDAFEDGHDELRKDYASLKEEHRLLKRWADNAWVVFKWITGVAGTAFSGWLLKKYG